MDQYDAAIEQPPLSPSPIGALADLDSLVAEVGATYPLFAYTAPEEEDREEDTVDEMILAGLVSP
jgi:hypothetical protein